MTRAHCLTLQDFIMIVCLAFIVISLMLCSKNIVDAQGRPLGADFITTLSGAYPT
jgi:hypothetical protein